MLYTREFFELGEVAPQSGRRRDAVRAAVREQHGSGEERDRHLHGSVPERRRLGQHAGTAQATTSCCSGQLSPDQINVDAIEQRAAAARVRAGAAQSLSQIGMNSAVDLFSTYAGTASRASAVAAGREHQPRSQPAASVPRRARAEPVSERVDLRRYADLRERISNNLFLASDATTSAQGWDSEEQEVALGWRLPSVTPPECRRSCHRKIHVPLRPGDVVGVVGREADGGAVRVQLAEHLHQRVARSSSRDCRSARLRAGSVDVRRSRARWRPVAGDRLTAVRAAASLVR